MPRASSLIIFSFLWIIFASFSHHLETDHPHELEEKCQECSLLNIASTVFYPTIGDIVLEQKLVGHSSDLLFIQEALFVFNGSSVLSRAPPLV
jgi:hypothetical protein